MHNFGGGRSDLFNLGGKVVKRGGGGGGGGGVEGIFSKFRGSWIKRGVKKFRGVWTLDGAMESDLENAYDLKIHDNILPKVTHTKFLGVIIDDRLSWDHHIKTKKLSCYTGSLNQKIESIPENLHNDLYHTFLKVI